MIIVKLLRWLFGYIRFKVEGAFPERFLNAAARRGINLWQLTGHDNTLYACARRNDYPYLLEITRKTDTALTDIQSYGLPHLLKTYRHRAGLLIGLILFGLGCHYLSGIVWYIDVRTPSLINEYEVRQMLEEHGLKEGTPAKKVDVSGIINSISISDKRVSWMTVNIMDTNAEVNISPNLASVVDRSTPAPLSNMKSIADGTVTKVEVSKGSAYVKVGDGISKNQLLVSGLMEYNNGEIVLTDCEARVFAKTNRSITIRIPKKYTLCQPQETVTKRDMKAFGLGFPLSLTVQPSQDCTIQTKKEQLTLLGHPIPVYVTAENWTQYTAAPVELTLTQAQELLQQKLSLYEFFMLSSTNHGTVCQRKISVKEEQESFSLTADYEIEEDVCTKTVVPLSLD